MRQISVLKQSEREKIKQIAAAAEEKIRRRPQAAESALTLQALITQFEQIPSATVLHFPQVPVVRGPSPTRKIKVQPETASLPLFDYAEGMQRSNAQPSTTRSDQWFADFGWRG
jgi:hypothetical protein